MGTLKIKGIIELNQFWPLGKSDADTIKIHLNPQAFLYKSDTNSEFHETDIFQNARVKGNEASVNVIKYKNTSHPSINVRLQGIDAPELHYKLYGRLPKKNLSNAEYNRLKEENSKNEFRQWFAETATQNLVNFLKEKNGDKPEIDCTFISQNIKSPSDICDIYGRFVGDIYINNESININRWLLEKGWVFPAFYNSLFDSEIDVLLDCYQKGKSFSDRTLYYYTALINKFDYQLQFRDPKDKPVFITASDQGEVILPKFYRRWSIYNLYKEAGINVGSFKEYLKSRDNDRIVLKRELSKFRNKENVSIPLSQLFDNDRVKEEPENIIFIEQHSYLIGEDNKELHTF